MEGLTHYYGDGCDAPHGALTPMTLERHLVYVCDAVDTEADIKADPELYYSDLLDLCAVSGRKAPTLEEWKAVCAR